MISYTPSNAASIHLSEKGIRLIVSFLKSKQTGIRKIWNFQLEGINNKLVKSNETGTKIAVKKHFNCGKHSMDFNTCDVLLLQFSIILYSCSITCFITFYWLLLTPTLVKNFWFFHTTVIKGLRVSVVALKE